MGFGRSRPASIHAGSVRLANGSHVSFGPAAVSFTRWIWRSWSSAFAT